MNEDEILKRITRAAAVPVARAGWKPLGTVQIVEWCGHGQEFNRAMRRWVESS